MLKHGDLPGGPTVVVATAVVVAAALLESALAGGVGTWTGATLVVVSVAASLLTRRGDRSLPAMMPPLAFLAAATAGQVVSATDGGDFWVGQATTILEVLGANARWVVTATCLSVGISLTRHALDLRRDRRHAEVPWGGRTVR